MKDKKQYPYLRIDEITGKLRRLIHVSSLATASPERQILKNLANEFPDLFEEMRVFAIIAFSVEEQKPFPFFRKGEYHKNNIEIGQWRGYYSSLKKKNDS